MRPAGLRPGQKWAESEGNSALPPAWPPRGWPTVCLDCCRGRGLHRAAAAAPHCRPGGSHMMTGSAHLQGRQSHDESGDNHWGAAILQPTTRGWTAACGSWLTAGPANQTDSMRRRGLQLFLVFFVTANG